MTRFAVLFCTIILNFAYLVQGASYSTNIIWSTSSVTYYRPSWSGNVSINYTEWVGDIPGQILRLEGIVLPISTTGSDSGLDKGHLMALSNGGPDISLNVVPQSSQWQQSGGWRQMEMNVYNFAKYKYEWNAISHASEIQHVAKPNSCNVIFFVEAMKYNVSNGQPLLYNGSVSCGVEIYKFIISPPPDSGIAVWYPHAPPSNSSNDTDSNDKVGLIIGLVIAAIVVFFCVVCIFKYRNETKKKAEVSLVREPKGNNPNEVHAKLIVTKVNNPNVETPLVVSTSGGVNDFVGGIE